MKWIVLLTGLIVGSVFLALPDKAGCGDCGGMCQDTIDCNTPGSGGFCSCFIPSGHSSGRCM